jgi:hypothetical protein
MLTWTVYYILYCTVQWYLHTRLYQHAKIAVTHKILSCHPEVVDKLLPPELLLSFLSSFTLQYG